MIKNLKMIKRARALYESTESQCDMCVCVCVSDTNEYCFLQMKINFEVLLLLSANNLSTAQTVRKGWHLSTTKIDTYCLRAFRLANRDNSCQVAAYVVLQFEFHYFSSRTGLQMEVTESDCGILPTNR